MNLVNREEVLLWENDKRGTYPHYLEVANLFEDGTEHFPEWKTMREIMQTLRNELEARRWFMS